MPPDSRTWQASAAAPAGPGWVPPTVPGPLQVQQAGASPTFVLMLGIGSLVLAASGCICGPTAIFGVPLGIVAWFWGSSELKKIETGMMPRSAKGMLEAGRICGLIGGILSLLVTLIMIFYFVIMVAGLSNAGGP